MRIFTITLFFLFVSRANYAQDKLFFLDGSTKKGFIVSNAKEFIYFKKTDTSLTEKIDKTKLILVEDFKGTRYIYGNTPVDTSSKKNARDNANRKLNSLGMQPLGVFVGRVSFVFERFTKDGKFGFAFPLILTFNPIGTLYALPEDSSYTPISGVSFITGLDLNYYLGKKESFQFYIGPRVRYGTDMYLDGIKGYTIQTQIGWKIGKPSSRLLQHVSIGFGFLRVIEVPSTQTIDPKQSFPWVSLNYRIGLTW